MNYEIEKHLIDMGILPTTALDELEDLIKPYVTDDKNHFNDPRDPITGEVPF